MRWKLFHSFLLYLLTRAAPWLTTRGLADEAFPLRVRKDKTSWEGHTRPRPAYKNLLVRSAVLSHVGMKISFLILSGRISWIADRQFRIAPLSRVKSWNGGGSVIGSGGQLAHRPNPWMPISGLVPGTLPS